MLNSYEIFLPKNQQKCDTCKQPKYEINKKFKNYIPDVIGENWIANFQSVLNRIYSLRSDIAHNGMAIAQLSVGLIPTRINEQRQLKCLFDLGGQFLVSWLYKTSSK